MALILSAESYAALYPNFPIDAAEFDGISQQAEDAIYALVTNELILSVWIADFETLLADTDFIAKYKKIIAQQCQVFYNANGLHATTGGADAGLLKVIDGVPFGQYAYNALVALLRSNGLMSRV